MAKYKYQVTNKYGKERKGMLEAATLEAAVARLEGDGNIVLQIKETMGLEDQKWNIQIGNPVKKKEMSIFCRQFYSILEAGVTVIDGLKMVQDQTENKYLRKALYNVQTNVEKGESLAAAMEMEGKIFPSILISMVASGEATGKLEVAFNRISTQFEKDVKLKSMVKQAMIYPILVLIVTVCVVAVLMVFVIPNFQEAFDSLDAELPLPTRIVIGISDFMVQHAIILILGIVALIIGIAVFKSTETGKNFNSWLIFKIPMLRNYSIKSSAAKFSNTMSTLIASGVPIVDGLGIVAGIIENRVIRKAIIEAQEEVLQGVPLSEPLEASGVFPTMVHHMLRIGEETGTVESMLDKVADYYEDEVEVATKNLTTAMEPLIMIVLALIVGGVVGSVVMPMVGIYQAVG